MNELFSTNSDTTRGLCFHPNKPWILAGLDNGDIELWDYDIRSLQHTFRAHKGPVRCVHFHNFEPLFVSGGADQKIVGWNHKELKPSFTLLGHGGHINSVQFHHQFPWIISASSDHKVRIWDWLAGKCICELKEHWDSVTSACFHPREPLILSASMDHTIRVRDIRHFLENAINHHKDAHWYDKMVRWLGVYGCDEQHVLRFNSAGFVSAAFHPTLPLICSASAVGVVETWLRTPGEWEFRPVNMFDKELSCVVFHPKQTIIVAGGGSRIVVGDAEKRTYITRFFSDLKNIQVLASHPNKNLLAAGHSNGIVVFKLGREFPVFYANNNYLYYLKENFLRVFAFSTQKDTRLLPVLEPGTSSLCRAPKAMSWSCSKTAVVICSESAEGSYKLYSISSEGLGKQTEDEKLSNITYEEKSGIGISAVFVTEEKFAVLEKKSDYLLVKKLNNDPFTVIALPTVVDGIFYAGTWRVLCRSNDRVFIWDFGLCSIVGDLHNIPYTRRVFWRNDMKYVALVGKHSIVIADKDMKKQCEIHETSNVKSGVWWDYCREGFVYTTLKNLKLCPLNGETEIVKSLDSPLYLAAVAGTKVCALDRDANLHYLDLSWK